MERTIILNISPDFITVDAVGEIFFKEGLIMVYDREDSLIGSVIYHEGTLILGVMDATDSYSSLETLMKQYPSYTFKFIN